MQKPNFISMSFPTHNVATTVLLFIVWERLLLSVAQPLLSVLQVATLALQTQNSEKETMSLNSKQF